VINEFLTQNWDLIVAAKFFTVEAWTRPGLQRFVILFFIELSTRKVEIAGIASGPNGLWRTSSSARATAVATTVRELILKVRLHDRWIAHTLKLRLMGRS